VLPARLWGTRDQTGGHWECLFLNPGPNKLWHVLTQTRGKPAAGELVTVGHGLKLMLVQKLERGEWLVEPTGNDKNRSFEELLHEHGHIPLPHYIRAGEDKPEDRTWYQTVFARNAGSVAAPTAGLHFTPGLIETLTNQGVEFADVTLHVGIGTFQPIRVERIEDHSLHSERAEVTADTALAIRSAKARGGRLLAVGTTSTRSLETASRTGQIQPYTGDTSLYITPGFRFQAVDMLLTNFHLPKSSLIVLVSAFAGHEFVMEAYREAVRMGYRFYSYGDAMLII
jgi:S-adenosylmethionine:tRNA ribosyltransferase-isomerase